MRKGWRALNDLVLGADRRVRERVRLSMIAVWGYSVSSVLLVYAMHIGLVERGPGEALMAYMWIGMSTFYLLVRSNWSSRMGSPGMDLPQCLYALGAILFAYAITGPVRSSVLMMIALVLVFGMFTLSARQVFVMGAATVLGLGGVMAAMVHIDPVTFDPRLELIKFVLAASTLPAVSAVAFYVAQVRARLVQQKAELRHARRAHGPGQPAAHARADRQGNAAPAAHGRRLLPGADGPGPLQAHQRPARPPGR